MPPRMTRKARAAIQREVRHYVRTGRHDDDLYSAWPSYDFLTRAKEMKRELRSGLVAEIRKREGGRELPSLPENIDLSQLARDKVTPMVRGLFPAAEQETVIDLLERSVVFLTHDNIEHVLAEMSWHHTAWDLANLYLGSIGARCLDGNESYLVGLSQETTCYVSLAYFVEEDPFADFVVHEAAHVFHNWKRERVGLPHTRYKEWLLPINFSKREEFAYACEAYSRILERAGTAARRRQLLDEYASRWVPSTDRIDQEELVGILTEAVSARNGWKRILKRCAPPPRKSRSARSAGVR